MSAAPDEAREFAKAFRDFMTWVHQDETRSGGASEVVALVTEHLMPEGRTHSVVSRELPVFEHVNVQVALEAWMGADGRHVDVHGFALPPHFGPVGLQQLLHGDALPPLRLSAPDLVDLPAGPDRTLACLRRALLLVEDSHGRYVVLLKGPVRHQEPVITLEIAGLPTPGAQEVLDDLAELRSRLNIYRGQLLELVAGEMGLGISFPVLPATARSDVVLPEEVLRRVERHTMEVSRHRQALRDAGQHLKRGLLLFGPPGTGKTHTTRYVVQQLEDTTVFMLSGQSLHFIGIVTQLARELQPAAIVLEDVDLVAEDRGFGPGPSPVLFTLLDAMDGAAADADLLFLLTTNRADLLEPALAARPGRVDVAVEIGRPDADARRRLLELYGRSLPLLLDESDVDVIVDRTAGVTASFVKELLRRATLEALAEGSGTLESVTPAHMSRALDDLLDSAQGVTRALLGVPDADGPPPVPVPHLLAGGRASGGHGGTGWAQPGYQSRVTIAWDEPT